MNIEKMFYNLMMAAILTTVLAFAVAVLFPKEVKASRESCECRELRAIRRLLEHQLGVTCDERRCLPVPTPTNEGGELP